ncbi:MAG: MerR family transcriptional regulator [Ignavibacteriales bacterium]|nr:MAG: MerR family transcriptional regulator [Ignavibacteriales bacterium]
MNQKIYLQAELISKLHISLPQLLDWEKEKLIKPAGVDEDKIPFYTQETYNECEKILKLMELGYEIASISKIIKKVGLPVESDSKIKNSAVKYLTVGELALKIEVSPRTIKHWEDKGIIESDMRSEGGFRLYSEVYVFFCNLILDLQNFGYSLDEIKVISDYFRDFLSFQNSLEIYQKDDVSQKLELIQTEIEKLFVKTSKLKEGIERWEELLKKKKKEIAAIKSRNTKR